ncbi:MAG: hypothetical protein HY561_00110, partial [Gemmatimonadetes bacterium]|nr:hypothetical protein [Gemmatimonadota bacterium]
SIYVFVSEQPAGVTLVSLRPDWEPRFLQPALEQSLGLPVRGYLRMPSSAYVRTGVALEGGRAVPEPEVRRAAAAADLLVLHGVGEDAPPWTLELARRARRVLVFPAAQAQRVGVPATPRPPVPGEWYITDAPPPSPLAPLLAAMPVQELAPLGELRPVDAPPGAWAPLEASRGRRGPTAPVLLAGGQGGRRWAVALADGFWQWAFRGGAPREAYRRLWAAVGGWLIEEETVPLAAAIRPIERVAARGVPVRWLAAGLSPDSLSLRVLDQQGAIALDTMLRSLRQDTAHGPVLPPGHYRYQARAFAQGREAGGADGAFTVESYSPEFTRPRVGLEGVVAPSASAAAGSFPTAPRRLHASPWPYLLFVSLLCVEWALRRRWGLR